MLSNNRMAILRGRENFMNLLFFSNRRRIYIFLNLSSIISKKIGGTYGSAGG
jgi:hypothetical protein